MLSYSVLLRGGSMNSLMTNKVKGHRLLTIAIVTLLIVARSASIVWAAPSSDELKKTRDSKQSEVDALNREKAKVDADISSYIEQIAKVSTEQKKTAEQLAQAQEEADAQYISMKNRIRYMYEEGSVSMINVLLESENM